MLIYSSIKQKLGSTIFSALISIFLVKGVKKMANIKSAKKRVLVNETKAANNKARNSALKTAIKKIDQAASKKLIHKNCAARKKSNLANKLNKD